MTSRNDIDFESMLARARAIEFPGNFVLGTATAAYQIEGAVNEDGRGESIWDRFSHLPKVIADGTNGDVACDHYRRWPQDIALMRQLQARAYRFSIAWPRILPSGRGAINRAGLDFYDRLVDELLKNDIVPYITLYHWDLPQALQDEGGGWLRRGIVDDFANYADIVTHRLGDRVRHWFTMNEIWNFTWNGYVHGEDAPGLRLGTRAALAAGHHALLAHGEAVPIIRSNVRQAVVGVVLDVNHVSPASDQPEDVAAATRFDGAQNRWYLDAVFKGAYPADMLARYEGLLPAIEADDLTRISRPIDLLGINVYRRSVIAAGSDLPPIDFQRAAPQAPTTAMGWEIWPRSVYDILRYVHDRYGPQRLMISENGAAFVDTVDEDGRVRDGKRALYLVDHLEQAAEAIRDGIPLIGYFAWTLMDNFEWAAGYEARFGLVHVDFANQVRRIKDSGKLFAAIGAKLVRMGLAGS
jgi:beta-glucosidase